MKNFSQIFFIFLSLAPLLAQAQTDIDQTIGLGSFGSKTTLVGSDWALTEYSTKYRIVQIINMILSFLGMLFTILIIYGGFRWMLSRGNSQQVDEAKDIMKNATIGLAIVLLSYVIARTIMYIFDTRNAPVGP